MTGFCYIDCAQLDDKFTFNAKGSWVSRSASDIEKEIALCKALASPSATISIDASAIVKLDTYGAWLLESLKRDFTSQKMEVEITGLSKENLDLFTVIKELNRKAKPVDTQTYASRMFGKIETQIKGYGLDMLSFANMLGAITLAFFNVLKHPGRFRFTSAVHQLDKVAWQALPIITLMTLLIGGIIAQQGFYHFRKLGAELYVVDMVGILTLREVGILLVSIMVAGRSGSAYTAELGSMKMREEIDALRTMGFNPIEVLILPRVLVLICAVPILTFVGSLAALYGGSIAAWAYGEMNPEIFIQRMKEAISVDHFLVGMIKAPFMGLVIGVVACTEGMKVKGSAESLGQQTTKSVVKAIFMVIILDGLFAIFFTAIGM